MNTERLPRVLWGDDTLRAVLTLTPGGSPVVVIERSLDRDAMGMPSWEDPLGITIADVNRILQGLGVLNEPKRAKPDPLDVCVCGAARAWHPHDGACQVCKSCTAFELRP